MQHVRLADLPWDEWGSPGGTFKAAGQQVSAALGAAYEAPLHRGGHPFDLEIGRIPPGKSGCPFHSHAAQWEFFYVVAGQGTVRYADQRREVRAGDAFMHPPGEAHQLINTGDEELFYYLVADNPPVDYYYYPDSDKWGISGGGFFKRQDIAYFAGEEPGAATAPKPRPPQDPREPLARFVHVPDMPWESRFSPGGRYGSYFRDLSLAVGGKRNCDVARGGHPFDVQIRRIPAGKAVCPFHSHSVQWELFVFLSGRAEVRSGDETHEVTAGDAVMQPPGTPHQTHNPGPDDLEIMIITDNPADECCYYPDSDKHASRSLGKVFRLNEVDYFDGEE